MENGVRTTNNKKRRLAPPTDCSKTQPLSEYLEKTPFGEEDEKSMQQISMEVAIGLPWNIRLRIALRNRDMRCLFRHVLRNLEAIDRLENHDGDEDDDGFWETSSWRKDWMIQNWRLARLEICCRVSEWPDNHKRDLLAIIHGIDRVLSTRPSARLEIQSLQENDPLMLCDMNVSNQEIGQPEPQGKKMVGRQTSGDVSASFTEWVSQRDGSRMDELVSTLCRQLGEDPTREAEIASRAAMLSESARGRCILSEVANQIFKSSIREQAGRIGVARLAYHLQEQVGLTVDARLAPLPSSLTKRNSNRAMIEAALEHYLSCGIPDVAALSKCLWNQLIDADGTDRTEMKEMVMGYASWLPLGSVLPLYQDMLEKHLVSSEPFRQSPRDAHDQIMAGTELVLSLRTDDDTFPAVIPVLNDGFCWKLLPSIFAFGLVALSSEMPANAAECLTTGLLFISTLEKVLDSAQSTLSGHTHIVWLLKLLSDLEIRSYVDSEVAKIAGHVISSSKELLRGEPILSTATNGFRSNKDWLPLYLKSLVSFAQESVLVETRSSAWTRHIVTMTLTGYSSTAVLRCWVEAVCAVLDDEIKSMSPLLKTLHLTMCCFKLKECNTSVSALLFMEKDLRCNIMAKLEVLVQTTPEAIFFGQNERDLASTLAVLAMLPQVLPSSALCAIIRGLGKWTNMPCGRQNLESGLRELTATIIEGNSSLSSEDYESILQLCFSELGLCIGEHFARRWGPRLAQQCSRLPNSDTVFNALGVLLPSAVSGRKRHRVIAAPTKDRGLTVADQAADVEDTVFFSDHASKRHRTVAQDRDNSDTSVNNDSDEASFSDGNYDDEEGNDKVLFLEL